MSTYKDDQQTLQLFKFSVVLKTSANDNVYKMSPKGCRCKLAPNVLWKAVPGTGTYIYMKACSPNLKRFLCVLFSGVKFKKSLLLIDLTTVLSHSFKEYSCQCSSKAFLYPSLTLLLLFSQASVIAGLSVAHFPLDVPPRTYSHGHFPARTIPPPFFTWCRTFPPTTTTMHQFT